MMGFLPAIWALVAAVLFALLNARRMPGEQMIWTALLCALWPFALVFFLIGTAVWLFGSAYHAAKRNGWGAW